MGTRTEAAERVGKHLVWKLQKVTKLLFLTVPEVAYFMI
jgi:hypothetical protein